MEKYKPSADNDQARMDFIDFWAHYVKTHPDKVWSKQQNVLINSVLQTAQKKVESGNNHKLE